MEADEDYSPTIITLTDENGENFMFEVVDEIEHNEENVDMIYDEFLFNEDLSTEKIICMIK